METPKGEVGAQTERIMAEWLRRLGQRKEPRPNTATYNAAYEACVEVLSESAGEEGK